MRLLAGMNRQKFSELFGKYGLNPDKLYSYEHGKAEPNEVLIKKLAEYAGVTVDDLTNKELTESEMFKTPSYSTKTTNGTPQDKKMPDIEVIRHYEELVKQLQETVKQQKTLIDKLLEKT